MRGEPDRVVPLLSEPVFEQVTRAGRNLDALQPRLVPGDQLAVRDACAVTPVGRVCGTAIGIELKPDRDLDAEPLDQADHAAVNRSHCRSGSGPASSRNGVCCRSCAR